MGRPKKPETLLAELEKRIAGSELLSDEEKQATLAKARAHVEEQRKQAAIDQLFQQAVRAEQAAFDPNEELVEFVPDLPEFTACITINGTQSYYHGLTYKVPMSLYRDLRSIQFAANSHEREIEGKRRTGDLNRRPKGVNLSPHGAVSTAGNMRI